MSEIKKIEVVDTIKDGIVIGTKNIGPVLVNLILWVLTIWIPYINVGTTIGLFVGIIAKASKGEAISTTEIFDGKYRKYMGEYFLTNGLMCAGIAIGIVFFIIPGLIIAYAWFFAPLIAIDKGKNPAEALSLSNAATYGNKGKMFLVLFLFGLLAGIVGGIVGALSTVSVALSVILMLAVMLFVMLISIGIQASLYKQLTSDIV